MWVTSRTGSVRGGFGEIWEKSVSWDWDLGEARRICALRAPNVMGDRWKSQHRKIVPLSLCRKTFKLKGNKKFRTWTKKSLSVFLCFGIPMCVMNILCTFPIIMYGYVTYFRSTISHERIKQIVVVKGNSLKRSFKLLGSLTQSAGTVEYTDCISAEG